MAILSTLPTFFPFSFRFFLPSFYPAPTKQESSPSAAFPFTPVSTISISSLAAHALTNHAFHQLPPPPPLPLGSVPCAHTPPLTVPVRAHLRHTRSVDVLPAPQRPPLRPRSTNLHASSSSTSPPTLTPPTMPYASPSASPTVVLSAPHARAHASTSARDLVLNQSFVFPAVSRSHTPSPVPASAMASKSPAVLFSENKENSGPSRAVGPMPLIPRTSSSSRLRTMSPGTISTARPPPAPATVTPVPAVLNDPPPPRASPPRQAAPTRHARKPSLASTIPSRELTSSPQQPSPPPSSPVSSRAPVNLRLDLLALKRTLSEAQVATQHRHAHSHSSFLQPPATASAIVTTTPMNTAVDEFETPPLSRSELMIRKKSGELVKSAIRTPGSTRKFTKSEPTTPTGPKFVHFDAQLEHVKLFLAEQKPAAVSRDGSPTETSEGELSSSASEYPFPLAYASSDDEKIRRALAIRVLNMPPPSRVNVEADVRLEGLQLSDDARALNGSVIVRNIAFAKWVAVRFTLDKWQTTSEVSGKYVESLPMGGFDRFSFSIRLVDVLPRIEAKTMELAVRYTSGGREMWDNNGMENYRVEFSKKPGSAGPKASGKSIVPAVTLTASSSNESVEGEKEKEKRSEWPVKSAVGDQMADLRRELEKVVREEMSPPSVVTGTRAKAEKAATVLRTQENFGDSPLSKRYSFGASLKSPSWRDAPSPPPSSVPFPSGSSSPARKYASPLHSRTGSGASSPSSSVPFPSIAAKPKSPPRVTSPPAFTQTFSPLGTGDLPRMAPRGSPRDAPYDTEPQQTVRYDGLPSAGGLGGRQRRHQRSYFDNWPSFGPTSIRKTPPGTPGSGLISPGRFNSYPPLSPAREDIPRPSPPVQQQVQEAVPAIPWANLIPLPPSPPEDSTASSTPSIGTEASSVSQSPMSPPLQTEGEGMQSMMRLEQEGSGPGSYTYFLDRFCFYTGGPGDSQNVSPGEATPRRALSASSLPVPTFSSPPTEFVATFAPSPGTSPSKAHLMVPPPPAVPPGPPSPVSPPSERT